MPVKPKIVKKPWGREIIYADTPRYIGKILVIEKGQRLSLQYHRRKHETLYALEGRCTVLLGGKTRTVRPGAAFVIPPKTIHRFEARHGRVTLLEVSTAHAGDIVRLEDDYGRIKEPR